MIGLIIMDLICGMNVKIKPAVVLDKQLVIVTLVLMKTLLMVKQDANHVGTLLNSVKNALQVMHVVSVFQAFKYHLMTNVRKKIRVIFGLILVVYQQRKAMIVLLLHLSNVPTKDTL